MNTSANTQFSEEREEVVMEYLRKHGRLRVGDVSDMLSISPSTARLLLQKMQDKGLLKRTHGGAILNDKNEPEREGRDYEHIPNKDKKLKIAAAAAETVSDGDYICIGSGTTTFLMATLLHGRQELTVVTDSIPVANELMEDEGITVYVCGGWILKRNNACRGLTAENFFKNIRVDKSYSGADSVDVDLGITSIDFDPRTESAVCRSGKECYILADSSKFVRRPYIDRVVQINEITGIFTDDTLDSGYIDQLKEKGIKVVVR